VTAEQGRSKSERFKCPFLECSAKANINIAKIFERSLEQLLGVEQPTDKGGKGGKKETKGGKKEEKGKKTKKGKKDTETNEGCCDVS
jgi:hypothetical protein